MLCSFLGPAQCPTKLGRTSWRSTGPEGRWPQAGRLLPLLSPLGPSPEPITPPLQCEDLSRRQTIEAPPRQRPPTRPWPSRYGKRRLPSPPRRGSLRPISLMRLLRSGSIARSASSRPILQPLIPTPPSWPVGQARGARPPSGRPVSGSTLEGPSPLLERSPPSDDGKIRPALPPAPGTIAANRRTRHDQIHRQDRPLPHPPVRHERGPAPP